MACVPREKEIPYSRIEKPGRYLEGSQEFTLKMIQSYLFGTHLSGNVK